MLWGEGYNETKSDDSNHLGFDILLKQVGGSMAALEIFKILKTVRLHHGEISSRPGAIGHRRAVIRRVLHLVHRSRRHALEVRAVVLLLQRPLQIRVGATGSGSTLRRSSSTSRSRSWYVPRALCIQVGESDELFDVKSPSGSRVMCVNATSDSVSASGSDSR